MAGNGTHPLHQPAPVQPKGSLLDSSSKVLALVLGGLGAIVTALLFIVDRPTEAKVLQMINDKAGPNTFRIERLEKGYDGLDAKIDRMVEERLRERMEAANSQQSRSR